MSREIAVDTIWLRQTSRLAHTEYSLEYHKDYIRGKTGLDPDTPEAIRKLRRLWEIDFNWSVDHGLHGDWLKRGRATDMGHAVYASDGSDKREPQESPFKTPEEVWSFDPLSEYGLPDCHEQVEHYEGLVQKWRQDEPEILTTGGYYRTIVSGAIDAFGWYMLLLAAADQNKMEQVFDRFFQYTLFHMKAWAETSVEVIIQHDDFVWTQGPFMHPEFYRKVIIPRYAELWKLLHVAGKKVLFCSDGNFTMFAEDIAKAGADGFIFEPVNDFEFMAERFGQSHCLVGSCVDCWDMTRHTWDVVKASMDKTFELAGKCKSLIWAVGNHIPANVPPDMMDRYIEYLKTNL